MELSWEQNIRTVQESLESLNLVEVSVSYHAWTDSTINLQWLSQMPRTWTTFVANRVSEIQETLPREKWKHVESSSNPADLSSRGMDVDQLIRSELWWHGPKFLKESTDKWPEQPDLSGNPPEQRLQPSALTAILSSDGIFNLERFSKFSSFQYCNE